MTGSENKPTHGYVAMLEAFAKQARLSVLVSAVPLAIMMLLLGQLTKINDYWLGLLITVSFLSFGLGAIISWTLASRIQMLIAKEKLMLDGREGGKGLVFLEQAEQGLKGTGVELTEASVAALSKKVRTRGGWLPYGGYISMLVLFLSLIWD